MRQLITSLVNRKSDCRAFVMSRGCGKLNTSSGRSVDTLNVTQFGTGRLSVVPTGIAYAEVCTLYKLEFYSPARRDSQAETRERSSQRARTISCDIIQDTSAFVSIVWCFKQTKHTYLIINCFFVSTGTRFTASYRKHLGILYLERGKQLARKLLN